MVTLFFVLNQEKLLEYKIKCQAHLCYRQVPQNDAGNMADIVLYYTMSSFVALVNCFLYSIGERVVFFLKTRENRSGFPAPMIFIANI